MVWLALHLPTLSLEALACALGAAARDKPLALLAAHRIAAVNRHAAELGVRPGLKRATALALAPELLIGQADAARDEAALCAVVHVALAFTPAVTVESPHTVLLDVHASLRYFGGLQALQTQLLQVLAPLGHALHLASAPTALGAAWLARWRKDLARGAHSTRLDALQTLLARAPLALLAAGPEQAVALQAMGLHTLGDVRRLPRAGLTRRFGPGLLDELDRAWGTRPDPRRWLSVPSSFDSRLELLARAEDSTQILQGAAVLLARLVAWAQAQQARVQAFELVMRHEAGHRDGVDIPEQSCLAIALADASCDADHLQLLLRERLARSQLVASTQELRLRCTQLLHASAPNSELFPTRASEREGLQRLLERLRARLGDEQVQCLQPRADHRPEQGAQRQTLTQAPSGRETRVATTALPLHRPVWLLPVPQPLREQRAQPWLAGAPLHLLSGPERIEAGWWDGAPAARDYFIAQASDGALVWVYRARLPTEGEASAGWFLQGRFG